MSAISHLARHPFIDDLIPIILSSYDHWWPQDFLLLAQVSFSWLFYAQKRLYSCPSLSSFSACALLARSLQENPHLLQFVSGIELKPMIADVDERVCPKDANGLLYLLGLDCLKHVTFGGQLARNAERFLNMLVNPTFVIELVIDGGLLERSICLRPSVEWDESMFYRFPNLKKLRLANLELDICPSPASYPILIHDFILDNVDISGGYLCQMINGATIDFMGIFTTSNFEYDEQLRLALESCAIKCLHYEAKGCHPSRVSFLDVNAANTLPFRCLHLKGLQMDSVTLSSIEQQCRDLVELVVVGREVTITAQEWQRFINSGSISSLQRLGLPGGTRCPPLKFVKWSLSDTQLVQNASASRNLRLLDIHV